MKIEIIQGGSAAQVFDFTTLCTSTLHKNIEQYLNIDADSFYLTQNGRIIHNDSIVDSRTTPVFAVPRIVGGKGGFGSMLRAIGAQIEKTTNRDACRDLSGRRLRDINEEQRLKRWFSKQNERDEERQELKKQKLEKLRRICDGPPLPKTNDREYNQQRADMVESVFEAVDKGFEASTSSSLTKASTSSASSSAAGHSPDTEMDSPEAVNEAVDAVNLENKDKPKELKKKDDRKIKKTIFDDDLDSDVSSSDSEDEVPAKKIKVT